MFTSFILFGSVPLLSYYYLSFGDMTPFQIATLSSSLTLFVLGAIKSKFVSKPPIMGGVWMVLQGGLCAFSAFCLGDLINGIISQTS